MYIFSDLMLLYMYSINMEKATAPHSSTLTGKSHGRRSLVGCSPWGCEELDMTERLHFHFWLSCIGEGNGKPLQCSCLENPRDGEAWWAAIYGVTQSRTQLKWLSSSSSVNIHFICSLKQNLVTCFIAIFTLLEWSETEPTVSSSYAYKLNN